MDLDARVSKHAHAIGWLSRRLRRAWINGLPLLPMAVAQVGTRAEAGHLSKQGHDAVESVPSVSPRASATTLPYPPG